MDRALAVERGSEELVTAKAMQKKYRGRTPRGIKFICPVCRRPLVAAAFSYDGLRAPHFKHKKNDARAQQCELYMSSGEYANLYKKVPLPMFIRRSTHDMDKYVIEGGFRKLGSKLFSRLIHDGAVLAIGDKRYKVESARFARGLARLPFEDVSLEWGSKIELLNTDVSLMEAWGYPEDAVRAMVFTRDRDSHQGKRIISNDTLTFDTDYYLVAPNSEDVAIKRALPFAKKVGIAGSRFSSLQVFEFRLTKSGSAYGEATKYLKKCGFQVSDLNYTPELIWPPALTSNGEVLPLFEAATCIFSAPMEASSARQLYLHTADKHGEHIDTVALEEAENARYGISRVRPARDFCFVTTRDWVFSTAVLLRSTNAPIDDLDHPAPFFDVVKDGDTAQVGIKMNYPCEVIAYTDKGNKHVFQIDSENVDQLINLLEFEYLELLVKMHASIDALPVLVLKLSEEQASEPHEKSANRFDLLSMSAPKDVVRAVLREKGAFGCGVRNLDTRKAMIRRGLK